MAANQERDFYREAAELLLAARSGTLATVSAGVPYAALVTPAVNGQGEVVLLFSELAVHTKHLRVEPACALLVAGAHLPFPGIGHVRAEGKNSYTWVPIDFAPVAPATAP